MTDVIITILKITITVKASHRAKKYNHQPKSDD